MIQGARGWFTGMTQRDGMGREVGGGFMMGNTRKKKGKKISPGNLLEKHPKLRALNKTFLLFSFTRV